MKNQNKKELCNHQWDDIEFGESDYKEYGKQCRKCLEVRWDNAKEENKTESVLQDIIKELEGMKVDFDAGGWNEALTEAIKIIKKRI